MDKMPADHNLDENGFCAVKNCEWCANAQMRYRRRQGK